MATDAFAETFKKLSTMPSTVTPMMEQGIAQSREICNKGLDASMEMLKKSEGMVPENARGLFQIGAFMLGAMQQTSNNMFAAAEASVRAKSLPEAATAQMQFVSEEVAQMGPRMTTLVSMMGEVAKAQSGLLQAAMRNGMANPASNWMPQQGWTNPNGVYRN